MLTVIIQKIATWGRRKDGTTAIEFGFVAMPFFLMALGIIEISLSFAAGNLLEGGLNDAARLVKTGQIQQSGGTEQTFRDALCAATTVLVNCKDVKFEVIPIGTGSFFDAASLAPQYDEDGDFQSRGFDPGGVSDVMLVRAVYDYTLLTPVVSTLMSGGSGSLHLMSTMVFETEPYKFVAGE